MGPECRRAEWGHVQVFPDGIRGSGLPCFHRRAHETTARAPCVLVLAQRAPITLGLVGSAVVGELEEGTCHTDSPPSQCWRTMDTSHLYEVGLARPGTGGGGQQLDLLLLQVVPVGDTQLSYDIRVHGGPRVWTAESQGIRAGLPNVLWKGPESKHVKLCQPYVLCHRCSPLWQQYKAPTDLRKPTSMAGLQERSSSY